LELEDAERRYAIEPSTSDNPSARFEEQWARSLLDRVVVQLQREYADAGKTSLFENLKQYLVVSEMESAGTIGSRLGMSEAAVRVAAHRLRADYRACLRAEIAATVADPSEIDGEIAALFAAFSPKKENFLRAM
jgi:DNA-directed RNA polymerase specialized sigma24 family protein